MSPTLPNRGRVGRALASQLNVTAAARNVDFVHMSDYHAPLLSSKPFSITIHDVTFLDHPEWYPASVAAYKRLVLRMSLAKRPRAVVCVSHHTLTRLRAHHPEVFDRLPVMVIHSGVTRPSADIADDANENSDYFLTVSAIEPRKNHLGLLASFLEARRRGLRLTWKVVGAPLYDSGEIVAALRSSDGVEVVGRVSDAQLEQLYRGARFVATPSLEEGFGHPPLEAMARGVAVACSTGSALDETVREAAFRIPADDKRQWAAALLRLEADSDLRQRLIEAGLVQAGRFSWDRAAAEYVDVFRNALKLRPAASRRST
jgi:glycosyltransferase involved in cell wall biosynthesis